MTHTPDLTIAHLQTPIQFTPNPQIEISVGIKGL